MDTCIVLQIFEKDSQEPLATHVILAIKSGLTTFNYRIKNIQKNNPTIAQYNIKTYQVTETRQSNIQLQSQTNIEKFIENIIEKNKK